MSIISSCAPIFRKFINTTHIPLVLLQTIRIETYLLLVRTRSRISPFSIIKKKKMLKFKNIKLHFGCGNKIIKGWINIDGYPSKGIDYITDLRCPLPFSDNSTSLIFTEHVLEHLSYEKDIPFILKEFCRILVPDGSVRIIVPDLEAYCNAYNTKNNEWFSKATPTEQPGACSVNSVFKHFHKFIFDFEELKKCLEKAGFVKIQRTEYGVSEIASLKLDTDELPRRTESLCVEATKPNILIASGV